MSSWLNSYLSHESPWNILSHFSSATVKLCHSWGFPKVDRETRTWVPGIHLGGDPRKPSESETDRRREESQ